MEGVGRLLGAAVFKIRRIEDIKATLMFLLLKLSTLSPQSPYHQFFKGVIFAGDKCEEHMVKCFAKFTHKVRIRRRTPNPCTYGPPMLQLTHLVLRGSEE